MGICNFCLVAGIRLGANAKGNIVTVVRDSNNSHPLAKNIYVSPKSVTNPQDFDKKYHVLWVMALPLICRC